MVTGLPDGATVQLRGTVGDPNSVLVEHTDVTQAPGQFTWFVPDDHEGETAHLVVINADGSILLQRATTVGSNS